MSFRTHALIGLILAVVVVSASPVWASLDGNRFSSDLHRIELSRPDASWELRERLPIPNVVAAFVVGDGTAAAVLMHYVIPAGDVVTDAADLARREDEIAELIAQGVTGQPGTFKFERAEFTGAQDRIVFSLFFSNRETGRGLLENWIQGFIIRDNDDRQHIYAVRCAVTQGTFQSWASQFERIVPTLHYTGSVAVPTYTSRPIPFWWWMVGGGLILVAFVVIRSRRLGREEIRIIRPEPRVTSTPAVQDEFAPVDLAGQAQAYPDDDVPSILRVTSGGPSGGYDEVDTPAGDRATQGVAAPVDVTETTIPEVTAGYWTCRCGRKNANADSFCLRCNADRP